MSSMRRTKIVCTIGPASSSASLLDRLVTAGMDVARVNFSHGTHAEHAEVIRQIRLGEERWGRPIAILQDLQGPKIRLGMFGPAGGGRVDLEPGQLLTLSARPTVGTGEGASVTHPEYLGQLKPGDEVWMDDGMIQLRVDETIADAVRCRVVAGGRISDHKGISFPGVPLPVSCLTDKDRDDLRFGIRQGIDFVAVSFVRSAADIGEVRKFLRDVGADLPIVAKLERQEIVANLPGILTMVDAVMVARGDLGVDVPLEEVPHIQKEVIRQARAAKVPVIVATQMLESMVTHLRPTRAEVSDVSTAIFDGADAIMLSAETATGRYPVEAVSVMARIAERADGAMLAVERERRRPGRKLPGGHLRRGGDGGARARRARHRGVHRVGLLGPPHLSGPAGRADHCADTVRRGPAAAGAFVGCLLPSDPKSRDDRRDDRGGRSDAAEQRLGAPQRRDRHHLRIAHVGPGNDESLEAPPGGRAPGVRLALGRPAVRRLVPVLIGLVVFWFVAGIVLARALAARHDTAATATLASVRTIVAAALEEVRREASLLAQDPAVVEGATRSDWATLVRGAWPRILALTQERRADLLLIVDASGAPLVQVPAARHVVAAAVARPPEAAARLAVIDERPYVLGIAPMPAGLVIVGRRFESLAGAVARLPSRPALVVVAGDRALGSTLPGAPPLGWDTAVRAGQITISGELWFARQLGEAGGLWALVSAREQRRESSRLWFWWAVSLSAAGATAVGIAAVSGSERGDGATEGGPRPTRPGEASAAGREASAAGRLASGRGRLSRSR